MDKTIKRTFPSEWQAQSGVMITWPHKQTDFASELTRVELTFCELAAVISQYEQVIICSSSNEHTQHIYHLLSQTRCIVEQVQFYSVTSNDSWARDHGPITVIENGKPVLLDFEFNGWGKKYPYELDNQITATLESHDAFNVQVKHIDLVLEGGSIDSDGKGTILTTSQCLLTDSRNPDLDKTAIEQALQSILGVDRVLWLEHGQLLGDDTDGHIDMLARFINANTLCYMACQDEDDPHHLWLSELKQELLTLRTANDKPYQLLELPFPDAIYNESGQRLPASYCNFLIINEAVLLPVYDCPQDQQAVDIMSSFFLDRTVIPINCRALIEQYGSLHCVTMQLPAGVLADKH